MLGLILSRLSQQNINWNAQSVKQLLTPLYLENTNSITPVMIIINNVVCFSVLRHNDRVEGQKYGVFGCIHTRPNTHTHTHYREQQRKYLLSEPCVQAWVYVCEHAWGCVYSPLACCHDSPMSHKPGSAKLRKSGALLCHFIVWHGAAAGRWRNLIIKRKLVILAWESEVSEREEGWFNNHWLNMRHE